jgi:CHASE2 domain-containing sensor protein
MNIKAKLFIIENILILGIWAVIMVLSILQGNRLVFFTGGGVFGLILITSILFLIRGKTVSQLIGVYAALIFFSLYVLDYLFFHNNTLGLAFQIIFVVILQVSLIINLKNSFGQT